jgi:SRSO17 transposase
MRWPIEQCFEECKSYLGMDHYESRYWKSWHRHMLFVFIAHLFLQQIRMRFKKTPYPDSSSSPAAYYSSHFRQQKTRQAIN